MPDPSTEIFLWSLTQPLWQRDALRRLFTGGTLSSDDIEDALGHCKGAYGLSDSQAAEPLKAEHLKAREQGSANAVSLVSLTHHDGVNALAPEQTISFGQNLTIVFGENGTGKSGYGRILKQACRSRKVEEILGNVLGGSAPLIGRATIKLREADIERPVEWQAGAPSDATLSRISVFDAHCVPIYLGDRTDVAFRPFDLDVFDNLATLCAVVRKRLEAELALVQSVSLPALVGVVQGTRVQRLIDGLSALTKEDSVRTLGVLSETEQAKLKELRELQRELQTNDPKKRAAELTAKATRYTRLVEHLKALNLTLGADTVRELLNARALLESAAAELQELLRRTLTPDLLPGTGEKAWGAMWAVADSFIGGSELTWIAEGQRCPLCQQVIGIDAASRLAHLAEFVLSTAQKRQSEAQAEFDRQMRLMLETKVRRADIDSITDELIADEPAFKDRLEQYLADATTVHDSTVSMTADVTVVLANKLFENQLSVDIEALAVALAERAGQLTRLAGALSPEQQRELDDLESRGILNTNLQNVLDEIERRRKIALYGQCVNDTTTNAITKKSSDLTKLLITEQLKQAFQSELKALQFRHLAVAIEPAGGAKGEHFHKLAFSNAPNVRVTSVLSEGESRTLALASFLTELSTASHKSAIIFDDPVSSLDHRWRERIGTRLVEVAKERQVIVFTHDLVFMKFLEDEASKLSVDLSHRAIRRERQAGVCLPDVPWVGMNTKKRLGVLRKRSQNASAMFRANNFDGYETAGREIYGLLREAWEAAVSDVLLNNVVDRFRFSIETNRLKRLHDITEDDCKAVDEGMTESSRWIRGHAQAAADGTPFPEPDELEQRIKDLADWAARIGARRN